MYDQKEVEELYDEYLSLDGNVFLDVDVDISKFDHDFNATHEFDVNFIKHFPNLNNNNNNNNNNNIFTSETAGENLDEPDVSIQLDLLNQNFITPNGCEFYRNQKDSVHSLGTLGSNGEISIRPTSVSDKKDEFDIELKEIDEKNAPLSKNAIHRTGWGADNLSLWHSGPSSLDFGQPSHNTSALQDLSASVTYNAYEPQSLNSSSSSSKRTYSHQQLGAKVEMVYSLLSMLDTDNREDMSKTFLAMSSSPESCHAMRQSGCLPLLVQLIHSSELDKEVRNRAAEALHNVVHAQSDEKRRRREMRVLELLQQIREYCEETKIVSGQGKSFAPVDSETHPINAMGKVMKFSFDAEHRQAICTLGGLHAIAELIQVDHEAHGSSNDDALCITLRRYAGMSLTNLTFGDGKNKALLCSFNKFMRALVDQLRSPSEDLRQVTASVLRNLSWRADSESKQTLRQVGAVTALTISAMEGKKEATLKAILSALWNLSAHCSLNKIDICSVPGALAFLVKMLKYKSASNTLAVVENAGGILRNISSHIAVREDYRQILRDHNCFEVLLEQLKSPSLTIVSNACGTLWNLSARCSEDQRRLWEMGATSMLRSLVQSKHKMISMGSSAALKNLLAANPNENLLTHLDSTAKSLGLQNLPTLFVRKQRALEQELNITLAETCDNIEPNGSPTHPKTENELIPAKRSDSRDSVMSTQSDSVYERINQMVLKNEEKLFENKSGALHESLDEKQSARNIEDQKLMRRYKTSMIPTPTFKKLNQDRINEKTKEDSAVEEILNKLPVETETKSSTGVDAKEKNKKGIPVLRMRSKNKTASGRESPSHQSSSSSNFLLESAEEYWVRCEESESLNASENVNSVKKVEECSSAELDSNIQEKTFVEEADFRRANASCERHASKEYRRRSGGLPFPERITCNENISSETLPRSSSMTFKDDPQIHTSDSIFDKKVSGRREFEPSGEVRENLEDCRDLGENIGKGFRRPSEKSPRDEKLKVSEKAVSCYEREEENSRISRGKYDERLMLSPKSQASQPGIQCGKRHSDDVKDGFFKNKPNLEDCQQEADLSQLPNSTPVNIHNLSKIDSNEFPLTVREEMKKGDYFKNHSDHLRGTNLVEDKINEGRPGRDVIRERRIESSPFSTRHAADQSYSHLNTLKKPESSEKAIEEGLRTISYHIKPSDAVKRNSNEETDFAKQETCTDGPPLKGASESTFTAKEDSEKLDALNAECDSLKKSSNPIVPNFRIGSQITDAKALQYEANKICREIQRHQDFEMGCSLTSEVSLVSCGSFLDPGDYSLFEISGEGIDFEESESQNLGKAFSKVKNFPFRKPSAFQTPESVSLPSLGSCKNEQIEGIDLDSSVISVASITSEIADTYVKDNENFNTYTKTYKNDSATEYLEDTLADGDETLNADLLQNNTEIFEDDNSLHSQENLPLDCEGLQDLPSDQPRKRLTPKEKRKTFHERYRTYTIRDVRGCVPAGKTDAVCEPGKKELTETGEAIGRNQFYYNDGGRYYENEVDEERPERYMFHPLSKHETLTFSKSLDKEQYCVSTVIPDSKSLNDLLSIGPAERKELVDNAKLVAFSLKTAVHDFDYDLMLDTEVEDHERSAPIDTATYSKSNGSRSRGQYSTICLDKPDPYEDDVVEEDLEKKGPRILKPHEKDQEEPGEEVLKAIRGRRKQLYSSPLKKSGRLSSATSSPNKSSQTTESRKSLNNLKSVQPPSLQREATFTKEEAGNSKKTEAKSGRGIPVYNRNPESKGSVPVRSTVRNKSAPALGSSKRTAEVSRITRPLSTYASRTVERRTEADAGHRRFASPGAASRTPGDGTKRHSSAGSATQNIRSSSSSQNIRASASATNVSGLKSRSPASKSPISKSDASLNAISPKDKGKKSTPKKEVTSKIASLWRKVEETKQKNKNVKDSRVWIGAGKSEETTDEVLVIEQEEIVDIPTRKIVHSFTCQGLAEGASHSHPEEGNSMRKNCGDLPTRLSAEEKKGKTERRNIISAVVPPYNYNPPVAVQAAPPGVKQVDAFHKGSLKVTTV